MEKEAINSIIAQSTGTGGDFCSDLNAMHEAEKSLVHTSDHDIFRDHLKEACVTDWLDNKHYTPHPECATATQRAEAFLRTLNLWQA